VTTIQSFATTHSWFSEIRVHHATNSYQTE